MTPRPWVLAETNWKTVAETEYHVAILPWGATEAHNHHLPYATDVIDCDVVPKHPHVLHGRAERARSCFLPFLSA